MRYFKLWLAIWGWILDLELEWVLRNSRDASFLWYESVGGYQRYLDLFTTFEVCIILYHPSFEGPLYCILVRFEALVYPLLARFEALAYLLLPGLRHWRVSMVIVWGLDSSFRLDLSPRPPLLVGLEFWLGDSLGSWVDFITVWVCGWPWRIWRWSKA